MALTVRAQVTNRILFIFDDSYSMYAPWNSNVKIEVAKKVMAQFLDSLKNVPNLEIALRCYGHTTFFKPERNCKDTKLEVPFAPANENAARIKQRIQRLEPMGTTPIAYSLGESANDFPEKPNCRNMIILITDGIEECGGNPCKVSYELQRKGIFIRPFVIGIGLDASYTSSFGCIGKFYDVSNEANFLRVLNLVMTEALTRTSVEVDLLDISQRPVETDVNMTFYEAGTNKVKYNYLHTINHNGKPDTLILDPSIQYDLVVHTIPPQIKKNIQLQTGRHNIIPVAAPQGFLKLDIEGGTTQYYPVTVVRKAGEMTTLNIQEFGKTEKYIVGKYDLEILTLPRIQLKNIEIKQSFTNSVKVPGSGPVVFMKGGKGNGAIYVDDGKKLTWVCNLNADVNNETIYLQPGKYKVVFRMEALQQTTRSVERNFEVKTGQTTTVKF